MGGDWKWLQHDIQFLKSSALTGDIKLIMSQMKICKLKMIRKLALVDKHPPPNISHIKKKMLLFYLLGLPEERGVVRGIF